MSYTLALAEARELQTIVQSYGVKCTIELQIGRPWTGDDWFSRKYVLINHDTVGPMTGLTPSLKVCKEGRPGVPGPLCNAYGGRDLVLRILCMGLANHPGEGGPLTIDGVTLPKDSARISSFGIEWEHNGVSAWPSEMFDFMGKVGAAVLDWMGRKTINSIEHATWTTRKIDRSPGFNRNGSTGQLLIGKYRGKKDDDMPTEAEFYKWMDEYFLARLKASSYDPINGRPNSMHPVKKAFTVAPWHQALGDQAGQDADHPLVNMHTVMGDIYWTLKSGILDKILLAAQTDEVDEEALANLLAPMIGEKVAVVTDADLARIATAVADEQHRRQAE